MKVNRGKRASMFADQQQIDRTEYRQKLFVMRAYYDGTDVTGPTTSEPIPNGGTGLKKMLKLKFSGPVCFDEAHEHAIEISSTFSIIPILLCYLPSNYWRLNSSSNFTVIVTNLNQIDIRAVVWWTPQATKNEGLTNTNQCGLFNVTIAALLTDPIRQCPAYTQ